VDPRFWAYFQASAGVYACGEVGSDGWIDESLLVDWSWIGRFSTATLLLSPLTNRFVSLKVPLEKWQSVPNVVCASCPVHRRAAELPDVFLAPRCLRAAESNGWLCVLCLERWNVGCGV